MIERPFNTHDRVSYNGHTYAVSKVVWSPDQRRWTLGLVGFDFVSPVIWVSSELVGKV